jgi:hypothetical protein
MNFETSVLYSVEEAQAILLKHFKNGIRASGSCLKCGSPEKEEKP